MQMISPGVEQETWPDGHLLEDVPCWAVGAEGVEEVTGAGVLLGAEGVAATVVLLGADEDDLGVGDSDVVSGE